MRRMYPKVETKICRQGRVCCSYQCAAKAIHKTNKKKYDYVFRKEPGYA